MTRRHDVSSRPAGPIRRLAPLLALVLPPLLAAPATAQPLPATCANGGPNYRPFGMTEFLLGDVGTPMLRHTLSGPDSKCNDGSQAIMYIRPADAYYSGPGLSPQDIENERWVIILQGGGGCGDADSCYERWCGISGFDRAGKMSTLGAYDAIPGADGILMRNPAINHFAGYNQVLIYYCSSDTYVGSAVQTGVAPAAGPTYDIEFQGEAIVNDAISQLLAGAAPDPGPAATFWSDPLPTLASAEEIILAGSSAGSVGLRHHLDRLRAWLAGAVLANPVRIAGVLDAGLSPGLYLPTISWTPPTSPADYADYLLDPTVDRHTFWGTDPSAIDSSCLDPGYAAAHNAVGVHPEICYDTTYTAFNHIRTPFFAHQDIDDPVSRDIYVDWSLYSAASDLWGDQFNQLVDLATLTGGLEPVPMTPGVNGTHCRQHVSLLNGEFFNDVIVPTPGGPVPLSFHDLLRNWL